MRNAMRYPGAGLTRRQALACGAGAALLPVMAAAETLQPPPGPVITRPIPSSGERLPVVGLGTWQIQRKAWKEGLIAALDYAETHNIRALRIQSDSELMVKQMRGQYKVKSEELRPLFERAKKMVGSLEMFRIDHVYREQNREADGYPATRRHRSGPMLM